MRFPLYFIAVMAVYFAILLLSIGYFILPAVSFGLLNSVFCLFLLIFFLPLILFLLYLFDARFPLLQRHELIMRMVIIVFSIISFMFFFLVVPIV
jgi:hypothetical protein